MGPLTEVANRMAPATATASDARCATVKGPAVGLPDERADGHECAPWLYCAGRRARLEVCE